MTREVLDLSGQRKDRRRYVGGRVFGRGPHATPTVDLFAPGVELT